jgi:hypothetical protein
MEYKQPTPDLETFVAHAQAFWDIVDVDAMQPVIHGDSETDEMKQKRANEKANIERLQKEYDEYMKGHSANLPVND